MGLLQLCLEATSFVYNDVQYKQLSGLPMGSPISVVLSEIMMQHLEKRSVSQQPVRPLFWFRYIDDCIAALPSTSVDDFLNHLNSQHRNIQFTCEQQQDNGINFLDMTIRIGPCLFLYLERLLTSANSWNTTPITRLIKSEM